MTTTSDAVEGRSDTRSDPRGGLRWWREVAYVLVFYGIYTWIRNQFGSASVDPGLSTPLQADVARAAFDNARLVIDIERGLGLFFEQAWQEAFLENKLFLQFWNVFYGTFHFGVTLFALIWTFLKFPARYRLWRNTLLITTATALIGFATFPLMPPRLLDSVGVYGASRAYGFVDTLAEFGGLWSFDSGAMQELSNQYAAMPSLHIAWACWSVLVLFRYLESPISRGLIAVYPALTLFGVIVTGNHYWIDAVGGAAALAIGYGAAYYVTRWFEEWRGPTPLASTGRHPT